MTDANQRQAVFKSLIALGKSQGYLIRAEAVKTLLTVLTDDEQLKDVLQMFGDCGIFVGDAPPAAAELAALKTPPVIAATTPTVAPRPVSTPIGPPIVVLNVGAEGGGIRLIAQELATGWRYRYTMLDQSLLWLDEGGSEIRRQSQWVYEWIDALASLDKYPWANLLPLEVHPQFADRVLAAARERLAPDDSFEHSQRRLRDWSRLCLSPKT
jgi:hypothetical protein